MAAVSCLWSAAPANIATEDGAVIRCPECSTEIDVDEDEVEEGEILSCPELESELEVSQTHPVHLNVISDDLDEEEEEEEESEMGEDGDYSDGEEEEEYEDGDEDGQELSCRLASPRRPSAIEFKRDIPQNEPPEKAAF